MKEKNEAILKDYLYKEVAIIVDELFIKLRKNNINVELERNDLNEKELNIYLDLYKEYEENLINLKNKAILKFGFIDNFDYIFAKIIENTVNKNKNYD